MRKAEVSVLTQVIIALVILVILVLIIKDKFGASEKAYADPARKAYCDNWILGKSPGWNATVCNKQPDCAAGVCCDTNPNDKVTIGESKFFGCCAPSDSYCPKPTITSR